MHTVLVAAAASARPAEELRNRAALQLQLPSRHIGTGRPVKAEALVAAMRQAGLEADQTINAPYLLGMYSYNANGYQLSRRHLREVTALLCTHVFRNLSCSRTFAMASVVGIASPGR